MTESSKSPGTIGSLVLALLGVGAILCGIDAILSESVQTPAKYGGNTRVYGADTVFVGIGWIVIGAGLVNKVVASRLGITAERPITVGLCAVGAAFWGLVFL